jgi:hypothetical protein
VRDSATYTRPVIGAPCTDAGNEISKLGDDRVVL